jgi:hypothetical protein
MLSFFGKDMGYVHGVHGAPVLFHTGGLNG